MSKEYDPPSVGVPERSPELDNDNPFGRLVPVATDQEIVPFPPDEVNWKL